MKYLIRLVTPKYGTTIDPFFGSGTTGKSALEEGNYLLEEQLKTLRRSIAQLNALELKRPSLFSLKAVKNYSKKGLD